MIYRYLHLGGCQSTRQSRVRVAIYEHTIVPFTHKNLLHTLEHQCCLSTMGTGTHCQIVTRSRQVEFCEETCRHTVVVMLTRMQQILLHMSRIQISDSMTYSRSLNKLGPCPDYCEYTFHKCCCFTIRLLAMFFHHCKPASATQRAPNGIQRCGWVLTSRS